MWVVGKSCVFGGGDTRSMLAAMRGCAICKSCKSFETLTQKPKCLKNRQLGVERFKTGENMTYVTYIAMTHVFSRAHCVGHVSHDLVVNVLKYCMAYMTYIVLKACGLM